MIDAAFERYRIKLAELDSLVRRMEPIPGVIPLPEETIDSMANLKDAAQATLDALDPLFKLIAAENMRLQGDADIVMTKAEFRMKEYVQLLRAAGVDI